MSDALDMLGGAERARLRARGFVSWEPRAETQLLLDQVQSVLDEYEQQHVNCARRAELIPMWVIRDTWSDSDLPVYPTEENAKDRLRDWQQSMRGAAARLRLDRQKGQQRRLIALTEAASMGPQIAAAGLGPSPSIQAAGLIEPACATTSPERSLSAATRLKFHIAQSRVVAGAGHAARAAGAAAMTGRRSGDSGPPAMPPGQSSQCSLWSAYLYPYARARFCKLGRKGNGEKNIEIRKH